jgi:hypothetical protein
MHQVILKEIMLNNQDIMKWVSKIIALNIRNRLEDFHVAYLPDSVMPELNREIRGGIYDALVAIVNYDTDEFSRKFINYTDNMIPDYWEDPELQPEFQNALSPVDKITFESAFLNEQYQLGNLYQVPNTSYIRAKASFEFAKIDYDDRRVHLEKISRQLRKENYIFDHCLNCYIKQSL